MERKEPAAGGSAATAAARQKSGLMGGGRVGGQQKGVNQIYCCALGIADLFIEWSTLKKSTKMQDARVVVAMATPVAVTSASHPSQLMNASFVIGT